MKGLYYEGYKILNKDIEEDTRKTSHGPRIGRIHVKIAMPLKAIHRSPSKFQ
jgi:hypothetical protein